MKRYIKEPGGSKLIIDPAQEWAFMIQDQVEAI